MFHADPLCAVELLLIFTRFWKLNGRQRMGQQQEFEVAGEKRQQAEEELCEKAAGLKVRPGHNGKHP